MYGVMGVVPAYGGYLCFCSNPCFLKQNRKPGKIDIIMFLNLPPPGYKTVPISYFRNNKILHNPNVCLYHIRKIILNIRCFKDFLF